MKPPDGIDSDDHEQWLARAQSNLIRAQQQKPKNVFWEDLCYDAQQAAEKALKALLIKQKQQFRKTHDIGELFIDLKKIGIVLPPFSEDAVILTDYAVAARYPDAMEPVTEEDYLAARKLAEEVVAWVESQI